MGVMNQSEKVMDIENVSFKFEANKANEVEAVSGVNLSIYKGEFMCLLGPSGCGKSTLLNILAGLLIPTEGKVSMLGEKVTGVDWRRSVIFQTPTLFPWLTTHDNVAFGPKSRGIDSAEIEKRTKKYLDLVELSDFGAHKPYELSGGMRQRVALARALANDPYMILMDEPFGALDALTRVNMQALIRKVWKENNNTIFLITHDVDEALTLGTKVLLMSKRPGRIIKEISIDFTNHIDKTNDNIRYSKEYIDLRKNMLKEIQVL